jgi:hypothetical protein
MAQGHSKIQKRHIALLLAAVGLVAAYAYRQRINEQLGCWAYYDQCTAKRISGLSSTDCLARADAVAYLTTDGVCLVPAD